MDSRLIVIIAMCAAFYHISGLATTNILRLTKGNTLSILSPKCECDNCGSKINPFLQLPIISYIICKGKCRNCGVIIPKFALGLEIIVLFTMCAVSALFNFSMLGVAVCFVAYELIRIIVIALKGKRSENFAKQYAVAVLMSAVHFVLIEFIAFVGVAVSY